MTEAGLYKGVVKDWGVTKAATGKFQHWLLFEINQRAKDDSDVSGGFNELEKPILRKVFKAMTAKTKDWLLSDLKSLGYDRKSLSVTSIIPNNDDSFNFGGRTGVIECTHETYDGKNREKWQITTRKGSVKLTNEDLSQLDQMFTAAEELDNFDPFGASAE